MSTHHVRTYSEAEHAAFRSIRRELWPQAYDVTGGPAQHAAGPYWPARLRGEALAMERLIPLYRTAAAALEREIASDPRCADHAEPEEAS